MRRLFRIGGRVLAGALLLLAAALGLSSFSYSREMAIDTSRGIDLSGYVRIGGIDQWIQIRGDDRSNPVLLLLNGGAGFSSISSTPLFRPWEKRLTVAMWDQRGEGRTFVRMGARGTGPMTVDRMTADGVEVASYLCHRLHKNKIIVLGHSWGTVLAIGMVRRRPDLFAAYVGTGQVTAQQAMMATSYPLVLARARSQGNQPAVKQLLAAGPPPWNSPNKSLPWFIWSNGLDPGELKSPLAADYLWAAFETWRALRVERRGTEFSIRAMTPALMQLDVTGQTEFEVPMIFIQGSEDLVTPTSLAKRYFDRISAPQKKFVVLRGDGHLALFRDRAAFLRVLVDVVRPLAK